MRQITHAVEEILRTARVVQQRRCATIIGGLVRRSLQQSRINRGVKQMRTHDDHARQSGRASENVAKKVAHAGVGAQDGKQLHGGRHAHQCSVEGVKRGVCVAATGETLEQGGNKLGQNLARARALHRRPAAEMPTTDRLRRPRRIMKAKSGERLQSLRIIRDPGKDKAAPTRTKPRRMFKQARIMALDMFEVKRQLLFEGCKARITTKFRKTTKGLRIRGQSLGLLVGEHLQAVLYGAQKFISCAQIIHRFLGHPAVALQGGQHVERARAAQLHASAAKDQLLRLDEEFHLANAATPQLHIVACDRNFGMAAHGMDLPLHGVDVGDGRIVKIFAPDERRQIRQKAEAQWFVASDRTRLDERRALPILAKHFVIRKGGGQRNRHRSRARIRAQAQIDPQDIAVARAFLQELRKRARHAHEDAGRRLIFANGGGRGIKKNDQVDIAGIVEFACPMLAHGEHDEAATTFGIRCVGQHELAVMGSRTQQITQGSRDGAVSEARQGLRHLSHIPHAAKVRERDQQSRSLLGQTQRPHHVRVIGRCIAPVTHIGEEPVQPNLRRHTQQSPKPRGISPHEPP